MSKDEGIGVPQSGESGSRQRGAAFVGRLGGDDGLIDLDPVWFKVGFYLFLLVWIIYIINESIGYTRMEDYFFPVLIGVPIALLIVIQLFLIKYPSIVDRVKPASTSDSTPMDAFVEDVNETQRSKAEVEKYELIMVAWVVLLPLMNYFLGMGITTVVYTYSFTWYFTRDVRTSAIVTAVVVLFIWILFIEILDMIIWGGTLDIPDPFRIISDLRS